MDPSLAAHGPRFTREEMAVRAAIDGKGIALIGDRLVADDIAAGRLKCPFPDRLGPPLRYAYHLLTAAGRQEDPGAAAFRS